MYGAVSVNLRQRLVFPDLQFSSAPQCLPWSVCFPDLSVLISVISVISGKFLIFSDPRSSV